MYSRKPSNAALCAQDRRRREDEAPRIATMFPELTGLKISVDERSSASNPGYIRRIVIGSAPAVFLLPCGDSHCSDGGHDITREMLEALRAKKTTITGSHACGGAIGSASCQRTIWYQVEAEYRTK